ncbi:MAG: hypothetical protein IPK22_11295 [Verrucomicrobiaceae bacterium]|nr:hypothetical protein [Verrucomicrobiaceae bacterium]
MFWRRLTSFNFGDAPRRIAFPCVTGDCCGTLFPFVRTRITTWSGSAKNCGADIQSYDSEADPGYYSTITGAFTRRYKRLEVTVDSCDVEITISAPSEPIEQSEPCGETTIATSPCTVPDICSTPPGCTIEEDPVVYSGTGEISESDVAAKAAEVATQDAGEWGDFIQEMPNVISGLWATDNRSLASASYRRTRMEIEVRGLVRPFLIQWQDAETTLGGGGTIQVARSLEITSEGVFTIEWNASADKTLTAGQGMVSIGWNDL